MYNHCTGHRGKFPERYAREENLTICFGERLRELVIGPEILAWLPDELLASDLTEQAARDQALRRHQAELDRLQRRLDTLYDDRLDGGIDGDRYDQKAAEIHEEQPRIRAQVSESGGALPPARAAVNLLALTSQKANGPVPPDAVLHFKDRNVKHVETANLELVPKSLMSRKFNPENRGGFGKPGAYKRKSTRERVAEERDARWKKAMAIG